VRERFPLDMEVDSALPRGFPVLATGARSIASRLVVSSIGFMIVSSPDVVKLGEEKGEAARVVGAREERRGSKVKSPEELVEEEEKIEEEKEVLKLDVEEAGSGEKEENAGGGGAVVDGCEEKLKGASKEFVG
jgi:hypothetical protein